MYGPNADRILAELPDSARVLDVGGWAQPFNRADVVLDLLPFDTRGVFGHIGPDLSRFSKDTWVQHDVSSGKPLPFRDKEFDFVVCSHVLEDIRDPLHLCSELQRVARRGYVETPSRAIESIMGLEGQYVGYYHHRWLVEIAQGSLVFRFKPHIIHASWRYHLPRSYLSRVKQEEQVTWLFWEGSFDAYEIVDVSLERLKADLEAFVRSRGGYSSLRYALDGLSVGQGWSRWLAGKPRVRRAMEMVLRRPVSCACEAPIWSQVPRMESRWESGPQSGAYGARIPNERGS